ncbi:MAG: type II toxin-antitoxin system prevent-host-death family antitoxin [Sulfuriferula sp.]|nr:type II toxin-antitoxin system prevent-host-death family antitoxin [Sulfuriferula sp.]
MRQVAFTELRNNAKIFFDLVETGESVRILRNGKPIADIVPIAADLPSWKKRKAQPLVVDGVAISQLILDERSA